MKGMALLLTVISFCSLLAQSATLLNNINQSDQNYWERTSGPGTVTVYDFVFKDDFILLGSYHGGIYKSVDGGESWELIHNAFEGQSVYALELLSNGNILAGTKNGIHISSDNGENWFYSTLPDYSVSIITLDKTGSVYVGSIYGEDIYRSNDDGINWMPLNTGFSGIRSIVTDYSDLLLVATNTGVHKSTDTGLTWQNVLPPDKFIMDLSLNQNDNLYAISEFGAFYLSDDNGNSWDSVSTINHTARLIYSSENGTIYIGSSGIYRSTDEGQTWDLLNGSIGGLSRSIAESDNSIFVGKYFGGVFKSTNNGDDWFQSSNGLNNSSVSLFAKDGSDRVLAVSNPSGISLTIDNGENWHLLAGMSRLNSLSASPGGLLFGAIGSALSGFIFRSTDSGYTWEIIYESIFGQTISQVNVNVTSSVFAIIGSKLYKSINNGNDWTEILIQSPDESIKAVTFNSIGYVYVQSSSGYFRSSDDGTSWIQLTPTPIGLEIFGISSTNIIYGTSSSGKFYSSTNLGDTWNFIYDGNGHSVKSFTENTLGYLFIILPNDGVLRSTDFGSSWQEINSGLESASVHCLISTADDYLLAGTSWGGVYRSVNKTTSIEYPFETSPNTFLLSQNYPNPFNPTTIIKYEVPEQSFVELKIYDVLGNEVDVLLNEEKVAGSYNIEFDGSGLTSGIYFYIIQAGSFVETKKMVLMK